jgi:hypothetical protein
VASVAIGALHPGHAARVNVATVAPRAAMACARISSRTPPTVAGAAPSANLEETAAPDTAVHLLRSATATGNAPSPQRRRPLSSDRATPGRKGQHAWTPTASTRLPDSSRRLAPVAARSEDSSRGFPL